MRPLHLYLFLHLQAPVYQRHYWNFFIKKNAIWTISRWCHFCRRSAWRFSLNSAPNNQYTQTQLDMSGRRASAPVSGMTIRSFALNLLKKLFSLEQLSAEHLMCPQLYDYYMFFFLSCYFLTLFSEFLWLWSLWLYLLTVTVSLICARPFSIILLEPRSFAPRSSFATNIFGFLPCIVSLAVLMTTMRLYSDALSLNATPPY